MQYSIYSALCYVSESQIETKKSTFSPRKQFFEPRSQGFCKSIVIAVKFITFNIIPCCASHPFHLHCSVFGPSFILTKYGCL